MARLIALMSWSSAPSKGQGKGVEEPAKEPSHGTNRVTDLLDWLGSSELHGDIVAAIDVSEADCAMENTCDVPCAVDDLDGRFGPSHARAPRLLMPKLGGRMASATRVHGSHQRNALASAACCAPSNAKKHVCRDVLLEEEVEWLYRQRLSGVVGRLVTYHDGQDPQDDIFFRGGGRGHVVVASVRDGGNAYREGIQAGDRLVAIDGRKDFLGMTAEAVNDRLRAPTVLVFLGFVGKKHAEVRLFNEDISWSVGHKVNH